MDQNILRKLSEQVDDIVFISGTNGKTTTSNLIGHTLKANQIKIIHNNEGANMAAGITSAFIMQISKETKIAIIEIDEGSIRVLKEVTPSMMVFTNFFRDQMDRFGEIDIMVNNIAKSISNKGIKLLLNADDPFVSRLKIASDSLVYYGMKAHAHEFEQSTMNESKYCLIVAVYCNMIIYITIKSAIIIVNVVSNVKTLHMKYHLLKFHRF